MKMIIIAVVLSLVVSGAVIGVVVYMLGDKVEEQPAAGSETAAPVVEQKEAQYKSLDPKFTLTFKNQQHAGFMQFSVEVMTRDEEVVSALKNHMPVIRSSLLLLFGVQEYEKMSTREGKEELLLEIVEDMNATLEKVIGKSGIEAAYFNSFLIQ